VIDLGKRHYIIPIFVPHEGCPHNCVFCNQDHITGSTEIIDDKYTLNVIETYLDTMENKDCTIEVSFFGGTFTAINIKKQNMLLEVAERFKKEGKIQYIRLSTRPDYIDEEILTNLKNHSVDIIELGVQSMDEEVLIKAGRGHSKLDVIKASKLIKQFGFVLGHQVMLGLPGDSPDKNIYTVNELIKLGPDLFRIYPALVIKDTPMEIMYRSGGYAPYSLRVAVEVCKELYCMLSSNNINVIRMGLQPTDNISEGKDIIAGPFHPAFRELVEGSLYCDMIYDFCKDVQGDIFLRVNEKDISKVYANRKEFFIDIKKQLKTSNLNISINNTTDRGTIKVEAGNICSNLSIKDYLNNKVKAGKTNNL
jgi:histone acetyltransferase (RNA polymerase elongator complex component)